MIKVGASRFRGLVARVNDSDLEFAAKTASQHMAQPEVCDWAKINASIARYFINSLLGCPKSLLGRKNPMHITTYVDSATARCR